MYTIELMGFRSHTMGVHARISEALKEKSDLEKYLDAIVIILPGDLNAYSVHNEERRVMRISWSGESDCIVELIFTAITQIKFHQKIGAITVVTQKLGLVAEINSKKVTTVPT